MALSSQFLKMLSNDTLISLVENIETSCLSSKRKVSKFDMLLNFSSIRKDTSLLCRCLKIKSLRSVFSFRTKKNWSYVYLHVLRTFIGLFLISSFRLNLLVLKVGFVVKNALSLVVASLESSSEEVINSSKSLFVILEVKSLSFSSLIKLILVAYLFFFFEKDLFGLLLLGYDVNNQ